MKLSRLFLGASLAVLLCPFTPRAQETHQHKHEMSEKLGRVNFTVSCNRAAQQQFNRAVALLHSTTEKHPVTPGAIVPARELLGELLLELRQPQQALKEFEASLVVSPNRFNGLYGAAKAAELCGDREKARTFYARLTALGERSDGQRPELQAAKVFLASR